MISLARCFLFDRRWRFAPRPDVYDTMGIWMLYCLFDALVYYLVIITIRAWSRWSNRHFRSQRERFDDCRSLLGKCVCGQISNAHGCYVNVVIQKSAENVQAVRILAATPLQDLTSCQDPSLLNDLRPRLQRLRLVLLSLRRDRRTVPVAGTGEAFHRRLTIHTTQVHSLTRSRRSTHRLSSSIQLRTTHHSILR